uniref:Uncharacterized protein n=1 Tax=Rhizophora mucronata TaxID=61149 RepID=A0A2P2IQR8_RHIMU
MAYKNEEKLINRQPNQMDNGPKHH